MGASQTDQLLEEIVSLYQQVVDHNDVVVVEGLAADANHVYAPQLNTQIARTLNAETILSALLPVCRRKTWPNKSKSPPASRRNRTITALPATSSIRCAKTSRRGLHPGHRPAHRHRQGTPPAAAGHHSAVNSFAAPRTLDIAQHLNARVLASARLHSARVSDMLIAARSITHLINRLKPGALVITPATATMWCWPPPWPPSAACRWPACC